MDANHDQHERSCAGQWASIVQLLTLGSRNLRRLFGQQAAQFELSETQFMFLFACCRADDGLCQSDLAEQTGLSAAQVSSLVEQLERRELLEVGRSVTDRRRRVCRPSDQGRAQLNRILTQVAPSAEQLRDQIGQLAQDQLGQTLRSLLVFGNSLSKEPKSDTLNPPDAKEPESDTLDPAIRRATEPKSDTLNPAIRRAA